MESIQAYTLRQIAKFDTNRNGVIELTAIVGSGPVGQFPDIAAAVEGGSKNSRSRRFFELGRNPVHTHFADQISLSQVVQTRIDTNQDNQISLFEKVKAWFKFGIW